MPKFFPPGLDEVGLMCVDKFGNPTYYWDTEIRFVADSDDPGGFIWTVVKSPHATSPATSGGQIAGWAIAGVIVGAVLVGLGAWGWTHRRAARRAGRTPSRSAGV